jgi:hypothetical protein
MDDRATSIERATPRGGPLPGGHPMSDAEVAAVPIKSHKWRGN